MEARGLEPQGCACHGRRWAGRARARLRARAPEGWTGVVEEARGVRRARPPEGGKRRLALDQRMVPEVGKRKEGSLGPRAPVLRRRADGWGRDGLDRRVWGVPATTNRVEQAIGRFRWRARGMRGITTWAGVKAAMLLSHLRVV